MSHESLKGDLGEEAEGGREGDKAWATHSLKVFGGLLAATGKLVPAAGGQVLLPWCPRPRRYTTFATSSLR